MTGAGGWIGRYLVRELNRRGCTVVATDRAGGQGADLDVTDRAGVLAAVDNIRPAVIVNLAGLLGTSELLGDELAAVEANIVGAVNIYDAAAATGARVVQIGTGHKGQPNTYAVTKACAEELGLIRTGIGQHVTVVRAFHAYGPGQAIPAPHGTHQVRKIVPSMVCRALTGMPIEIFGDGGNVIDLVHVADVAKALADATEFGRSGAVVDAGTGIGTTVLGAAKTIVEACGSTSEIVHLPARPGEPEGAVVVAERPVRARPWPYGLDGTVESYRAVLASQEAAR